MFPHYQRQSANNPPFLNLFLFARMIRDVTPPTQHHAITQFISHPTQQPPPIIATPCAQQPKEHNCLRHWIGLSFKPMFMELHQIVLLSSAVGKRWIHGASNLIILQLPAWNDYANTGHTTKHHYVDDVQCQRHKWQSISPPLCKGIGLLPTCSPSIFSWRYAGNWNSPWYFLPRNCNF